MGVSIDLTAMRRRESELSDVSSRLAQVPDMARMGGFRLDLQTRCFHFDRHFAALYELDTGRSSMDWVEWTEHLHPEDRPGLLAKFSRMHGVGDPLPQCQVFRIVDRAGKVRHIESHRWSMLGPDGHTQAVLGAHRDITDQVLALACRAGRSRGARG